jgi:predicted NodU family carbamoyl transferase
MYNLGISCYYHDSAAALLKDGHVIAAVEEECFSRKKFDDDLFINFNLQTRKYAIDIYLNNFSYEFVSLLK